MSAPTEQPESNAPVRYANFANRHDIVLALRFTGNFDAVERFVGGDAEFRAGQVVVAGPRGPITCSTGDWIVRTKPDTYVTFPDHLFHDQYYRPEVFRV